MLVVNLYLCFLFSLGCIATLTSGIFFAWTSPSIPLLISAEGPYKFTLEQCSYLAVIQPVVAMLGSFFYGVLTDKIGRKYALLSIALPQALAFICTALATNIYQFYIARIFSGIAEACVYTALPTYVAEMSTPKVRGSWGNMLTASIYLGYLVMNAIGGFLSIKTTAWICLIFPIIFASGFIFMPESPYYCLMNGKEEEARKSLKWLRRLQNVDVELSEINAAVKRQMAESGTWKDLVCIKSNRRALIAGIFLRVSQQFSGCSSFAIYTQYIFLQAGGQVPAEYSSIIYVAGITIANVIASFTLDKFGRRLAVLSSLLACSLILFSESSFFYVSLQRPDIDISSIRWFPLLGMTLYVPALAMGLGIVPSLMLGELFSASIKAKGLAVLTLLLQLLVGLTAKLFQLLETNYGLHVPFAVFGVCCLCNSCVAYFVVPETKGKTLEEIQQALKGSKKDMFK